MTAHGYGVSFWGDENVLEVDNGDENMLKTTALYTPKDQIS